ncbi:hypothetical protein JQS43_22675 [Natronosporangium hydrolyticum]|uniref:IPT/TIG domain-containing protein n=1 Tax=Natronosporangium hydrolyticum TaxID=2811111 RepID=A0A895YA91_9ACTN|nr:hypothetical protein [Natronosporangium hydrolyticum]QSB14281.1 hypothetical protein JQS43_22675 [Natronosporangium hydrolyticum]
MRELARRRLLPTCALLALAAPVASSAAAGPAAAAQSSGTGPEGQQVTVSTTTGIDRSGATVTVQGSGFDTNKGIYVAYCVDNGPGVLPSPCGGGADTSGSLGASHWISDNPPSYAGDLAVPYDSGGSFSVTLRLTPTIGDIDCLAGGCAVVTRADHTRGADRTQDVRVPVSFAGSGGGEPDGSRSGDTGAGTSDGGSNDGGSPAGSGSDPNGADGSGDGDPAEPEPAGGVAPAPSAAATPAPEELSIARVSSSGTAGTWWWTATASLATLLLGLIVTNRVIRRRRAAP